MKKVIILLVFVGSMKTAFAQTFNPYQWYVQSRTTGSSLGNNSFMKALQAYDHTIHVHHGIRFNDDVTAMINGQEIINRFEQWYDGKGFTIEDGLSLIYSFVNNQIRSGQHLSNFNNFFMIKDGNHPYVIDVFWSKIQHKMVMLAIDQSDKFPGFDQFVTLRNVSVIYKHN